MLQQPSDFFFSSRLRNNNKKKNYLDNLCLLHNTVPVLLVWNLLRQNVFFFLWDGTMQISLEIRRSILTLAFLHLFVGWSALVSGSSGCFIEMGIGVTLSALGVGSEDERKESRNPKSPAILFLFLVLFIQSQEAAHSVERRLVIAADSNWEADSVIMVITDCWDRGP